MGDAYGCLWLIRRYCASNLDDTGLVFQRLKLRLLISFPAVLCLNTLSMTATDDGEVISSRHLAT